MKRSEITTEMFENWKAEMREVFKNKPNSMDLIALNLRFLEDPKCADKKDQYNKSLMKFFENELARQGKLHCEFCGKPMEVYYSTQCFHCEQAKPKVEKYEGNYMCAVKWLTNNEPDFDGEYMWDYLCNNEILRGNDTYITLSDDSSDEKYQTNLDLFKKHFPIEDIKWFVSW